MLRLPSTAGRYLVAGWTQRDAEDIAELYADTVVYRSPAFSPPDLGLVGVRRYLNEQVPAGEDLECRAGQPIVSGDRAAVEWWASWTEQGQDLWFAGVTVLRFDRQVRWSSTAITTTASSRASHPSRTGEAPRVCSRPHGAGLRTAAGTKPKH